jgi:tripartite-type tricarboxylate transporter receptor subunit TctC
MKTFIPTFIASALALLACACACLPGVARAQTGYPVKPIRLILGYAPGGSSDTVARTFGQKLHERLGQPVVVDFRPGGNTVIAAEILTRAAPDGYTLLLVLNTHAISPLLMKLPYDPIKDFSPVASLGVSPYMLAINPGLPVNNLKEFIAYARARPGELNYSTSGAGGLGHLSAELFNQLAGVKTQHVPFKGGGPSVIALISGEVQMSFIIPIIVAGHIKAGKLKGIAVSGKQRLAGLPDTPTFAEAGLPQFESTNWFGVLAPAATPRAIIGRLSDEFNRIQTLNDVRDKLGALGIGPLPGNPEQFAALIKSDTDKFARVVKGAQIRLEY